MNPWNKYIVLKPHKSLEIASVNTDDRIISQEQWDAFKSLSEPSVMYFEVVSVLDKYVLLIDELGKMRDTWQPNVYATILYGAFPYDFIVDTAVLVARDEVEPGELRFLSDDEVQFIVSFLNIPNTR